MVPQTEFAVRRLDFRRSRFRTDLEDLKGVKGFGLGGDPGDEERKYEEDSPEKGERDVGSVDVAARACEC